MTEIEKKAKLNWEISVSISGGLSDEQIFTEGFKDGYEQGYALGESIANSAIESLQKKNAELKDKVQMWDFFAEGCGFKKRGLKTAIQISEYIDKLEAKIKKLRCCGNCMYFTGDKCTYAYRDVNYNDNCETWELAE